METASSSTIPPSPGGPLARFADAYLSIAFPNQEKAEVKKIARTLLESLKREKLVLDWRKKQQAKADVQITIDLILDMLPPSYTKEVYLQICTDIFQHVYESYFGQGKSVYAMAS